MTDICKKNDSGVYDKDMGDMFVLKFVQIINSKFMKLKSHIAQNVIKIDIKDKKIIGDTKEISNDKNEIYELMIKNICVFIANILMTNVYDIDRETSLLSNILKNVLKDMKIKKIN